MDVYRKLASRSANTLLLRRLALGRLHQIRVEIALKSGLLFFLRQEVLVFFPFLSFQRWKPAGGHDCSSLKKIVSELQLSLRIRLIY